MKPSNTPLTPASVAVTAAVILIAAQVVPPVGALLDTATTAVTSTARNVLNKP